LDYIPNPIDTENVILPQEIERLIEVLSRNTHEIWSKERLENGWSYGIERNDLLKQTPLLVPYDELPETEKEYDRKITESILKALFKLRFEVKKAE
jgi:ryanodine receptor 2